MKEKDIRTRLRTGDVVVAVAGKERFGKKSGKIIKIFPRTGRVLVQGFNYVKRHTKPTQKNPKGGIVEKEAPVAISNLQIYCPRCQRGSRIKMSGEGEKKKRLCARCGESLDKG